MPEILEVVLAETGAVVTVNVVLLVPAGMVTDAGTWAAVVLLLVIVTTAPDGGAAPFKVRVAVEEVPPVTVVGFSAREVKEATVTVSVVVRFTPAYDAVIVGAVWLATPLVVMVNVAVRAPAAMVTLASTCAAAVLLLDSVTNAPAGGAAPFKVTVPVELLPPTTEVGLLVTDDRLAAFTVKVAVLATPRVAVITEEVCAPTPSVVTVNVAEVLPAGTVTLAGTVAAAVLLLESVTTAPPVGAAPFSVTVPVELFPPTTVVGLIDKVESCTAFTVKVALAVAP